MLYYKTLNEADPFNGNRFWAQENLRPNNRKGRTLAFYLELTAGVFRTQSNIYDGVFCENN